MYLLGTHPRVNYGAHGHSDWGIDKDRWVYVVVGSIEELKNSIPTQWGGYPYDQMKRDELIPYLDIRIIEVEDSDEWAQECIGAFAANVCQEKMAESKRRQVKELRDELSELEATL